MTVGIPGWVRPLLARWWRPVAWVSGGILLLAALAWLALLFLILPRIDEWRDSLARQATRALGVPVQIGHVTGRAEGGWPVVSLSEVQLFDDRGQVALRLPQVLVRVSAASLWPTALWRQTWQLDRLVLVRPELQIRRDAQGVFHVAGFRLDRPASPGAGDTAADWLLSQPSIHIEKGQVRWDDALLGAPPLAMSEVDVSLTNRPGLGRRWHELKVSATPPAEFGRRFSLQAALTQPLWQIGGVLQPEGTAEPWWRRLWSVSPRPSQWQTWSGTVRADLPWVDVQRLKQHVALPIEVTGGRGRVSSELSVYKGQLQALSLDTAVEDVSVRLARDLAPLAFKRVRGRVSVSHEAEVGGISYENLSFETADGLVWPRSSASLQWRHGAWHGAVLDDTVWRLTQGGEFKADRLDLALLAQLGDRLPLSRRVRGILNDLKLRGIGDDLWFRWEGMLDAPSRYVAKGRFAGLSWAPSDEAGWPGLSNAQVSFDADEGGGRAQLGMEHGWVEFPGVFDEPRIPLTAMQSTLTWQIKPASQAGSGPDVDVSIKQATFANPDAQGDLTGHWQTGGRKDLPGVARLPGKLVLHGHLVKAQANRVWRYLPSGLTASARQYVHAAIQQGFAEHVSFEVDGDLQSFPFKNDVGGRFRVKVPVRQVTLDYAPSDVAPFWPVFTHLDGDLLFEGQRLRIVDAQARLGMLGTTSFVLRHVDGVIEDLGQDDPHLIISGQGNGPLDDALKYMASSPVGKLTGNMLGAARGGGTSALQLALDIPLDKVDSTTIKGKVSLKDSDHAQLRLAPTLPLFDAVVGEVGFTETALNVKAHTKVWGQAATVEGQRDASGTTRFVAQGVMSAEGLQQANEWPVLSKLAKRMSGQAPFNVVVTIPKAVGAAGPGQPVVELSSTLQGMETALPAPLNKHADAVWPLKVLYRADDPQGTVDALLVDVAHPQSAGGASGAPWLHVDLRRDVSAPQSRLLRGAINLLQSSRSDTAVAIPSLPSKGMAVYVAVPTVDVEDWQSLGKTMQIWPTGTSGSSGPNSPDDGGAASYVPDTVVVKTAAVVYQQRSLKDVSVTLAHPTPAVWRAMVESNQMSGQIEWLPEGGADGAGPQAGRAGAGRVVARLSRLSVPSADAVDLEDQVAQQMLSNEGAGQTVPALDIVVDQFEWRGLSLGKLEVEAVNRAANAAGGAASVPEWRLTKFKVMTPEAQFNASGSWSAQAASPGRRWNVSPRSRPRSSFDFTLDLQNLGDTLSRLGLPKTVRGGKGKVVGQISWQGSPMEPDVASMSGDMNVVINDGQFLKADPGIAKLLGVLSLQSLPRRLTLDFRDVFLQGFAFDAIDGQVKITQGVAETRNLRMRGVQAVVLMEGQADLAKETQNLHVYVIPDFNAVGASLAYAAINPVVGLGTFVAQVLLRKQVSEASKQEFMITGPWVDPQVEKVPSRSATPAAASAPEHVSVLSGWIEGR